jgi:hypothetical protein
LSKRACQTSHLRPSQWLPHQRAQPCPGQSSEKWGQPWAGPPTFLLRLTQSRHLFRLNQRHEPSAGGLGSCLSGLTGCNRCAASNPLRCLSLVGSCHLLGKDATEPSCTCCLGSLSSGRLFHGLPPRQAYSLLSGGGCGSGSLSLQGGEQGGTAFPCCLGPFHSYIIWVLSPQHLAERWHITKSIRATTSCTSISGTGRTREFVITAIPTASVVLLAPALIDGLFGAGQALGTLLLHS